MSMTCATPYRKKVPRPPLPVDALPYYGIGSITDNNDSRQLDAVFQTVQADPTNDPTLYFPAVDDLTFYYYLCPASYGAVTFRDVNGFTGGWDGASWPLDDIGTQNGPVRIRYRDQDWDLYRTDFAGGRGDKVTTSFANG